MTFAFPVIVATHSAGRIKQQFYMTANNNFEPLSAVIHIWEIEQNTDMDSDFSKPDREIIIDIPTKAYALGSFEVDTKPNHIYRILRDDKNPQDTALGDMIFLPPVIYY